MYALMLLAFFPLHDRQVELPDVVPPSIWTFEDGGASELAARLGEEVIYVLAPGNARAGYALYARDGAIELARFNWYLLSMVPDDGVGGVQAYTEGVLPSLADTFEWGLSVFETEGLELPTTSWEPGFPPESRDWSTWLEHLRANQDDHYDPAVEKMVEGWLSPS